MRLHPHEDGRTPTPTRSNQRTPAYRPVALGRYTTGRFMQDETSRISGLVVEADGLLRDMLRTVLAAEPRLRVVGVTGDASEAVRIAATEKPDVTLVGLSGESEGDALAVAQSVSNSRAGSRIVFLGEHPDRRTLAALPAFRAAGWSYLLRQSVTDVATLVRAIDGAAMGLVVLDPAVVESLGPPETPISPLTNP